MGVLYKLYDALVSINVPNEKALAVADAMEQDMLDKLATKTDLAAVRNEVKADFQLVRQEMASMRDSLTRDIQNLPNAMTIKFGGMTVAAVVLICTILGTLQILF